MAAKTIIATGVSSGLGFELVKQLLTASQPYRIILGARDIPRTRAAYESLAFDRAANPVTFLPCELSDLTTVKSFAAAALEAAGSDKVDYLLLNAAAAGSADSKGLRGSKYCEPVIVNHFSQHYLTHLLRPKLETSHSRIVVVSSGAIRNVPDTSVLDSHLSSSSQGVSRGTTYSETKFVQYLGAQWWRRELLGVCDVVACSPGLIPGTGLAGGLGIATNLPDAKGVPEGAASIFRAFTKTDLPEDPERMFITSWGEWWEKDVYANALDKTLQEKWCPSLATIEAEEKL